jgi:hypothetical protein
MVSSPATSEAGVHAAGDTKSEHFETARVRKLNEKQFRSKYLIPLIIWYQIVHKKLFNFTFVHKLNPTLISKLLIK